MDASVCVVKNHPPRPRERFNRLAEQLCISTITLAELQYDTEKSARRLDNLEAIGQFVARLAILPFTAAAHYGESRAGLERAGTPAGAYDMLIAGHARSDGMTVVTNNLREFERMLGAEGGELGVAPECAGCDAGLLGRSQAGRVARSDEAITAADKAGLPMVFR